MTVVIKLKSFPINKKQKRILAKKTTQYTYQYTGYYKTMNDNNTRVYGVQECTRYFIYKYNTHVPVSRY